jgi:transcriptional regulator with XRE-family HTH domain
MVSVVEDPQTTALEHQRALATIADALFLNPDDEGAYGQDLAASESNAAAVFPSVRREIQRMDSQEAAFANRLRELMTEKCVTQQELAQRIGCSQPAVSQMLNRNSRPHKKTILKLAEALNVQPQELWPDLEVADMLDAVASFQQDDYVMTEAEAAALRDTTRRNAPTIPVRSLPVRRR